MTALPLAAEPAWHFTIGQPMDMAGSGIEAAATAMARAMESHILAQPELWTWHHRRWRKLSFVDAAPQD